MLTLQTYVDETSSTPFINRVFYFGLTSAQN